MAEILLQSMMGLGDNIHQRAIVRYYLEQGDRIWMPTVWPQVYLDLQRQYPNKLKFIRTDSALRTQAKNAARSAEYWTKESVPRLGLRTAKVFYRRDQVLQLGGILPAMLQTAGVPVTFTDFRIPTSVKRTSGQMVYRPLVDRTEWGGCNSRNPETWAYGSLAHSLSDRFYITSIADLEPGKEWIAGADIPAAIKLHKGELSYEQLVDVFASAWLVFCSPGFSFVLAQAVGTPVVCVFGGHESSRAYPLSCCYAPTLLIDPIKPCDCFQHNHTCLQHKAIDYPLALARLNQFVRENCLPSLGVARHEQRDVGPGNSEQGVNGAARYAADAGGCDQGGILHNRGQGDPSGRTPISGA